MFRTLSTHLPAVKSRREDVSMTNFVWNKEAWDESYARGDWRFLRDSRELPRYATIAGYLCKYVAYGTIVDVGCGEAILCNYLHPKLLAGYVGVDVSEAALESAHARIQARYLCANMDDHNFEIEKAAAAVVLNEVLYYSCDPMRLVQKCLRSTSSGGLLIISMYEDANDSEMQFFVHRIWNDVCGKFRPVHGSVVTDTITSQSWNIRVFVG